MRIIPMKELTERLKKALDDNSMAEIKTLYADLQNFVAQPYQYLFDMEHKAFGVEAENIIKKKFSQYFRPEGVNKYDFVSTHFPNIRIEVKANRIPETFEEFEEQIKSKRIMGKINQMHLNNFDILVYCLVFYDKILYSILSITELKNRKKGIQGLSTQHNAKGVFQPKVELTSTNIATYYKDIDTFGTTMDAYLAEYSKQKELIDLKKLKLQTKECLSFGMVEEAKLLLEVIQCYTKR